MAYLGAESYVLITGDMVSDLKLPSDELIIYGVLFNVSQYPGSKYAGSLEYLAEWIGSDIEAATRALESLVSKGLVNKYVTVKNGVTKSEYTIAKMEG